MMRALLCVLLAAAHVLADDDIENRRSKLPYVADAVGNTLPPPSNGPATVGSPVNLLTPDRYEFYTFDESGELVKRLMTLEEIQAIVAAGEETEGLVTFANENQPTIAFNFSQPPYTKVHNVVTNVQNVLKAQMEAHKNRPLTQPTLDTPDVSDSWSLILPSIFGNTGVDIVPDKMSGTFTTPETETIDVDRPIDDNSLSKEGTNQIISTSSTKASEELKKVPVTEKISTIYSTTEKQKTTITTTTTTMPTPTSVKPLSTIVPAKLTTASVRVPTSTSRSTTTTSKLIKQRTTTSKTTVTSPQISSTSKPRTTSTSKPTTKVVKTTQKPTTFKPNITTKKTSTTYKETEPNFTKIQTFTTSADKNTVQYEKLSTFVPLSTATFVTERTTLKPVRTTVIPVTSTTKRYLPSSTRSPATTVNTQASITTYKPPHKITNATTIPKDEIEKFNATTVTTQSVSPSTTITSTEFVSNANQHPTEKNPKPSDDKPINIKQEEPEINFFDVAQSFSQIASDLGGDYQPIPTTSDLLDTTKLNVMNLESKENLEIEIPTEVEKKEPTTTEKPLNIIKANNTEQHVTEAFQKPINDKKTVENKNFTMLTKDSLQVHNKSQELNDINIDNFVKISTLVPHQNDKKNLTEDSNFKTESKTTTNKVDLTTSSVVISTTIDPILTESMEDLFSQVVNQVPQSIIEVNKNSTEGSKNITTDVPIGTLKIKDNKPQKNETMTGSSDLNKDSIDVGAKNKIDEVKNITNDIIPIVTEIKEKIKKPDESNQINEVKTNNKDPENFEANKQTVLQVSESINKTEDTFETISPMTTLKQDLYKNNAINSQEINQSDKPDENKKKKNEGLNDTATTTVSPKLELKKPIDFFLKPENISPNLNKITSMNHNKIANVKENEKSAEEPQLPKLDEFKKKIQKVNIDDKELVNERNNSWKLISTVSPPKVNEIPKDKLKMESQENTDKDIVLEFSKENQGLEVTTNNLAEDIAQFTELCNELAFRYWQAMTESIEKRRSFILSPYSITSMLAMMFMGARGATSGEMNEILKLDDMVTFNPHFTLKNISDSIETTPSSGVIVSAFVRELFSDRSKGKILTFYKERAQHFYNGHVEEINFKLISDIIRRRTNLLVKRYTWGRIVEYMKSNTITMQPPLAAFSANVFQTDCSGSSVEGRDGEMYFVVSPNVRQRRLVPVPAVVYRNSFLAGYDPGLDATAAALGNINSVISTLFLMPGQQGNVVHAEDLEALEKRLLDSNPTTPTWNRLLRTLLPRIGLELQIPRFSHKSIFNVSTTLQKMGLKELFDREHADLGGLNGPSKDLYLSDMVQSTTFVTCGEGVIGEQHHIEEYPDSLNGPQRRRTSRWTNGWDEPRDYQRAFHDPHDVGEAMNLPLHLRPRQARLPSRNAQPARLKFDRPFLYFVRHNPSGMILYVGRYNPRLLP